MTYGDVDFLDWDPFDGADRDVKIRARTVKIVTTKTTHKCVGNDGARTEHEIPPRTRARVERAVVDGSWGSYYICADCMVKWLTEREIPPASTREYVHGERK